MNKANDPYIETATRIYENIIDPWDREPDYTIELIAENLKANPLPALNFLLGMIDDLRA